MSTSQVELYENSLPKKKYRKKYCPIYFPYCLNLIKMLKHTENGNKSQRGDYTNQSFL